MNDLELEYIGLIQDMTNGNSEKQLLRQLHAINERATDADVNSIISDCYYQLTHKRLGPDEIKQLGQPNSAEKAFQLWLYVQVLVDHREHVKKRPLLKDYIKFVDNNRHVFLGVLSQCPHICLFHLSKLEALLSQLYQHAPNSPLINQVTIRLTKVFLSFARYKLADLNALDCLVLAITTLQLARAQTKGDTRLQLINFARGLILMTISTMTEQSLLFTGLNTEVNSVDDLLRCYGFKLDSHEKVFDMLSEMSSNKPSAMKVNLTT